MAECFSLSLLHRVSYSVSCVLIKHRSEAEGQWYHTVCLAEKAKKEQGSAGARAFAQWSGKRDPYGT